MTFLLCEWLWYLQLPCPGFSTQHERAGNLAWVVSSLLMLLVAMPKLHQSNVEWMLSLYYFRSPISNMYCSIWVRRALFFFSSRAIWTVFSYLEHPSAVGMPITAFVVLLREMCGAQNLVHVPSRADSTRDHLKHPPAPKGTIRVYVEQLICGACCISFSLVSSGCHALTCHLRPLLEQQLETDQATANRETQVSKRGRVWTTTNASR